AKQIGALQCGKAEDFWKPDVVANGDSKAADRSMEDRHTKIAGLEEEIFRGRQVVLAITADETVRTQDHRRVVERGPVPLGDARHDIEAMLCRRFQPCPTAGAVWHVFCRVDR